VGNAFSLVIRVAGRAAAILYHILKEFITMRGPVYLYYEDILGLLLLSCTLIDWIKQEERSTYGEKLYSAMYSSAFMKIKTQN
jgi:hypothetical protein